MDKPEYYLVSLSGGKDSTAMLLRMLEEGMQIDCILFCDTGLEFPEMYMHLNQLEQDIGREITRVRSNYSFEYLMFDKPVARKGKSLFTQKYGANYTGYGWAGPGVRWCTAQLKDVPKEAFLRTLRKEYTVIEYVGLAADELYRLERKSNQNPNHRHPLVDWGMTEQDCLQYCYDRGYTWSGLYEHFKRVSCWCCPLQTLNELRQLYRFYPDLWQKLKEWDKRNWRKFRADYSVEELEIRFQFEEECVRFGKPIKGRSFYAELKNRLRARRGIDNE